MGKVKSCLKTGNMVSQQEGRTHVGPLVTKGSAGARGEDGRQKVEETKGKKVVRWAGAAVKSTTEIL